MTKNDLINKAKYIQFPYKNERYSDEYEELERSLPNGIFKLPILPGEKNILYSNMPGNEHHYTTYYNYFYVLPILGNILNFKFQINDFNYIKKKLNGSDISYLAPRRRINLIVTNFTDGKTTTESYIDLMPINTNPQSCYRYFYKYYHKCTKIKNPIIHNKRKLFISGDSQMIPCILPLTMYFEEVWYFDNRTGDLKTHASKTRNIDRNLAKSFKSAYQSTIFTDVLFELSTNYLWVYNEVNIK